MPVSLVDAVKSERERFEQLTELLIGLALSSNAARSIVVYRALLRNLTDLEKALIILALSYKPQNLNSVQELQFIAAIREALRKHFSTAIRAIANTLRRGDIPPALRSEKIRARRIQGLTDSQRLELISEIRKFPLVILGKGGRTSRYGAEYLASLILHSEIGAAGKSAALNQAATNGQDLVHVSPQPSTIGDYCDLYKGRVFSISGTDAEFPPLSDCPNGGAPLHPWCHHFLTPVSSDSPEADAARKLPPIPEAFTELARANASPAEFMKLWRKFNS